MVTEVALLVVLIALSGILSLSEIAVVGSRRARLLQLAEDGSAGAERALQLAGDSTRFLSTVQVGITFLGILSGAVGQATLAGRLQTGLEGIPALARYAGPLSIALVVALLTYFSLIIGELVPKRLALTRPESFASAMAKPMQWLSAVTRPLVQLLTLSTDSVLRVFRISTSPAPTVTPEEIKVLIKEGAQEGVFEPSERDLMTNVLNLDERAVSAILTPRSEIVFLDVRDSLEESREKIEARAHTIMPLCDGGLDHVIGFARSARVLSALSRGGAIDLKALADPALFVPHTMSLMRLLEYFKRSHQPVALVIDEFGDVDGLVSLMDVVSAIVGELPGEPGEEASIVQRSADSWLVDGTTDVEAVERTVGGEGVGLVDDATPPRYRTLAGLAMLTLGRVPRTGDAFSRGGFRLEIVDMDGHRVDRVLITREPAAAPAPGLPGGGPEGSAE